MAFWWQKKPLCNNFLKAENSGRYFVPLYIIVHGVYRFAAHTAKNFQLELEAEKTAREGGVPTAVFIWTLLL